jgi:hypothetical protein
MTPDQTQIFEKAQQLKDLGHFSHLSVYEIFKMLLRKQEDVIRHTGIKQEQFDQRGSVFLFAALDTLYLR